MKHWPRMIPLLLLAATLTCSIGQPSAWSAPPAIEITPLEKGQILRGKFEQLRTLKGFDAPLKSTGSFTLVPGRGLIWRTEAPFAMTTIMSPTGLIQEMAGRETMRAPAARLPFMSKLYGMLGGALGGDWQALSGAFNVSRKSDAKGWQVTLVPLKADDPNMPLRSIGLQGRKFVEEVDMAKPNGDRERLVLFDQKLDAAALTAEEEALLTTAGKL